MAQSNNYDTVPLAVYLTMHCFRTVRQGQKTPQEIDELLARPQLIPEELVGKPIGPICRDSDGGKEMVCTIDNVDGVLKWRLKPCEP